MIFSNNYVGCKAIIRDDATNEILAETIINKYEKGTGTILINGRLPNDKLDKRVSLLILYKDYVYTYSGIVRKNSSISEQTEISLFAGKTKEDRTSKRYDICTDALIDSIIENEEVNNLDNPISVTVKNISTSGALIKAPNDILKAEDVVHLNILIANQKTVIKSLILRANQIDNEFSEYACQFICIIK